MEYAINKEALFRPLELITAGELAESCPDRWWNQTLCRVDDCLVRLGVFEGEFHWHKHDREDEFFLVLEGRLFLDLEGKTVEMAPRQGILVPRGISHRTRAPKRTTVLMIEGATVEPTGD